MKTLLAECTIPVKFCQLNVQHRYQVSGILIKSGEPLARRYYKWHPEKRRKREKWQNYGSYGGRYGGRQGSRGDLTSRDEMMSRAGMASRAGVWWPRYGGPEGQRADARTDARNDERNDEQNEERNGARTDDSLAIHYTNSAIPIIYAMVLGDRSVRYANQYSNSKIATEIKAVDWQLT